MPDRKIIFLSLLLFPILFSAPAFAMSEEEKTFLNMYFTEEELQVVSTTRSLKSITRVAENVEVITASDIELMNAHTLADVLNTINGVAVKFFGASTGSLASASIHGSDTEQVVVFIDGIAVNLLSTDQADISGIPVQMIEKVEVIKGPASSSWGSSLGGIINVITKSPRDSGKFGGVVSTSYGEKNTGDFRAEATGKKNGFGYYLSTGRLQTDGLRPVEKISSNNVYAKFTYDISNKTDIDFSLFYNNGNREEGDFSAFDFSVKDKTENLFSTLSLNSALSRGLNLNLSLRAAEQKFDQDTEILSIGDVTKYREDDKKYGASARLTWKTGMHNIVFGSDYDYKKLKSTDFSSEPDLNVYAVYANDTILIGKFSITPGIRYDYTDEHLDFLSPSLGVTYNLADKTILRAYVARGFHLPNLSASVADGVFFRHNPDIQPEKVWSYQAGVESGLLQYVWLKVSVFRHDISDAIVQQDLGGGLWTVVNSDTVRRQGFEVEMRTVKFYNFTLSAATTYIYAKNLETGEEIHNWPDYTYDISLKYDDEKSFRALLKGRVAWWQNAGSLNPESNFIFDINLIKTILKKADNSLEVFLTGHNIFNGSQYGSELFKNSRRWIEGGVRYKF